MVRSNHFLGRLVLVLAFIVSASGFVPVAAQDGGPNVGLSLASAALGSGFAYQGQLNLGGSPITVHCDFGFVLFDSLSGPGQIGSSQGVNNVSVTGGKFTVLLNDAGQFGPDAFQGDARWLSVIVRCPAGSGAYTVLNPRQAITSVPYALSLMPGAVISSSVSASGFAIFKAFSSGVVPAIWGAATYNSGVYGSSSQGNGVEGYTEDTTGTLAGVRATGSDHAKSIALDITGGGIRVPNAGINTKTPIFIHRVTTGAGGNICVALNYATVIDYPLINYNPNAILTVTPNYGRISNGQPPAVGIPAVFYDDNNYCGLGYKWVIYNLNSTALVNNTLYNVLVIVP